MKPILLSFLLVTVTLAFRKPPPPSSSSSMSSEEDSFEEQLRQQRMQVKKSGPIRPEPVKMNNVKLFDRPSSDELEAYDNKVQRERNLDFKLKEQPMKDEPIYWKDVEAEQPKKPAVVDEHDQNMILAALGQIYLDKVDQESRFGPMPVGPMGPGPMGPMDPDYFFVPIEEDVPKQANNNGNGNVHVNVNHVQVNSNVLHVPEKKAPAPSSSRQEDAPIIPAYHYSEPISTSKYLYLNLNMTDCVMLVVLVVAFMFIVKKTYKKCFPSKELAPQLPVTLPPTYSPSMIEVPKKVVQ